MACTTTRRVIICYCCMCCGHTFVDAEAGICGACGNEDADKMSPVYARVPEEEGDQ